MTCLAAASKLPVYLSYGMGVESTAILLRWLNDPASRDFALSELTVMTAQTGNEWQSTKDLVTTHILPRLRERGIRFVQVARAGRLEADGIEVLDDTREPDILYINGAYRLSDELTLTGTVPTFSGTHKCSLKYKAHPLEEWIKMELGTKPFRQVFGYNRDEEKRIFKSDAAIAARNGSAGPKAHRVVFGFNRDETSRIERSQEYDSPQRIGEYPLAANNWNWSREHCLKYIKEQTDVVWKKSACVMCPFARLGSETIERMRSEPEGVAEALMIEYTSLCMNPRGTLYRDQSLHSVVSRDGNTAALKIFERELGSMPFGFFRVRRIYSQKGRADRAVEKLATGTRAEMKALFDEHTRGWATIKVLSGIRYGYKRERDENIFPTAEEFFVCAPATVDSKTRYGFDWFEEKWSALVGSPASVVAATGQRRFVFDSL